jgi:hypothetical protein
VGDAKRQVENQRVEEEISAGNIESDLRKALEVRCKDMVQATIQTLSLGTRTNECPSNSSIGRPNIRSCASVKLGRPDNLRTRRFYTYNPTCCSRWAGLETHHTYQQHFGIWRMDTKHHLAPECSIQRLHGARAE